MLTHILPEHFRLDIADARAKLQQLTDCQRLGIRGAEQMLRTKLVLGKESLQLEGLSIRPDTLDRISKADASSRLSSALRSMHHLH